MKAKSKVSLDLTRQEREKIINDIRMKMILNGVYELFQEHDLLGILSQYIEDGQTIEKEFPILDQGKTIIIRLYQHHKPRPVVNIKTGST